MADKNLTFIKYMQGCPQLTRLYPLFGDVKAAAKHIFRLPDGVLNERKYVDGGKVYQPYFDWQVNCFDSAVFTYQPPASSENLSEYNEVQKICDWIKMQNSIKNFPKFDDLTVSSIECRPTNPAVAGVDENGIAKYTVGIRVTFGAVYSCE